MHGKGWARSAHWARALATTRDALLGLASIAALGCGEPAWDRCRPEVDERIGNGNIDHACLHTSDGPFQDVVAVRADGQPVPELRNTHTAYILTLPSSPDVVGTYDGRVRLRPRASGIYALYFQPRVPVRLTDPEDTIVCTLEIRDGNNCPGIEESRSYRLTRLRDYLVTLGPTTLERISLVLELLYESRD